MAEWHGDTTLVLEWMAPEPVLKVTSILCTLDESALVVLKQVSEVVVNITKLSFGTFYGIMWSVTVQLCNCLKEPAKKTRFSEVKLRHLPSFLTSFRKDGYISQVLKAYPNSSSRFSISLISLSGEPFFGWSA